MSPRLLDCAAQRRSAPGRFSQALKIALEVKKRLVDSGRLDVTQEELEAVLRDVMQAQGAAPAEHMPRFRTVSGFLRRRRPLIVAICGAERTGKSAVAARLGSQLNLPNILQADLVMQVRRGVGEGGRGSKRARVVQCWAYEEGLRRRRWGLSELRLLAVRD